jgi:hypothetical protein
LGEKYKKGRDKGGKCKTKRKKSGKDKGKMQKEKIRHKRIK